MVLHLSSTELINGTNYIKEPVKGGQIKLAVILYLDKKNAVVTSFDIEI